MDKNEKRKIINSFLFPFLFVSILWMIKLIEIEEGFDFSQYGLYPRDIKGLRGILFAPFIHGDFTHLFNNSIPLLILGTSLFYFYREVAYWVFFLALIFTGIWAWFFARAAFHIGASGIIYGLGAFLFVSGVIRKHPRLMAISLLVVFLYGSMIWGVLPIVEEHSWESHLLGAINGVFLAFWFRHYGPQKPVPDWMYDDDEVENEDEDEDEDNNIHIRYQINKPDEQKPVE